MKKQEIKTAVEQSDAPVYYGAEFSKDAHAKLFRETLRCIDLTSVGRSGPLVLTAPSASPKTNESESTIQGDGETKDETQKAPPSDIDLLIEKVQQIKLPASDDWENLPVESLAEKCVNEPGFGPGRFKLRIKQRSAPQVFRFQDVLPEEADFKHGHICCTLVLEDENGFSIQSTPVFLPSLVRQFVKRRNPRTIWDVLGATVTIESRILFLIVRAIPRDSFQEPDYSSVSVDNVRLDIIKNYAGNEGVKIKEIKPEIESRFGQELSYHMVYRALCDLSETRRKGRFGCDFAIPKSEDDENGLNKLHERVALLQKHGEIPAGDGQAGRTKK